MVEGGHNVHLGFDFWCRVLRGETRRKKVMDNNRIAAGLLASRLVDGGGAPLKVAPIPASSFAPPLPLRAAPPRTHTQRHLALCGMAWHGIASEASCFVMV